MKLAISNFDLVPTKFSILIIIILPQVNTHRQYSWRCLRHFNYFPDNSTKCTIYINRSTKIFFFFFFRLLIVESKFVPTIAKKIKRELFDL